MEKKVVEVNTENGDIIYVETEVDYSTLELIASHDTEILRAVTKFEDSLQPVINLAKSVINGINGIESVKPSEVELEFSIKLSGQLDFWVISGNGEGNISLKLKWDNH